MSLHASGLCLRRGDRLLLDAVSLQVTPGELHCVVGPNGAGKSTLLSLLAGDRAPDAGSIRYGDQALAQLSLPQRARMRAALPQRDLLSFAFHAEEVVRLGRMPSRRHSAAREDEIVEQAMRATAAWALRDRDYTTLSGGERARVQLARVLSQIWSAEDADTRILLLDEPTASLDIAHQHQCLQQIRAFARTGVAVVVVLHDLNLAMAYADRITVLDRGRVAASGTPIESLTGPLLAEVYGIGVDILRAPGLAHPVISVRTQPPT